MQNRKLFESIEKLVINSGNRKKEKKKEEFALRYCQEQLEKKKLIPRSRTFKMEEAMKKFKNLTTYIGVGDLIKCVNDYLEQQKMQENEKKKAGISAKTRQSMLHNRRFTNYNIQSHVLVRARESLKDHTLKIHEKENKNLKQFIEIFEESSNYLRNKMQNQNHNRFSSETTQRSHKIDTKLMENIDSKERWNNYTRFNDALKTEPKEQKEPKEPKEPKESDRKNANTRPRTENLQEQKKKNKILKLADIYLHIALEQQYRKRWNRVEAKMPALTENKQKKTKIQFLRTSIMEKICEENKSELEFSKIPTINNQDPNDICSIHTIRGCKSNQKQRIKKDKEIAIRKLNYFLSDLKEDENSLKNEKSIHLSQINRLEQHLNDELNSKVWEDEEKYEEIMKAINRHGPIR